MHFFKKKTAIAVKDAMPIKIKPQTKIQQLEFDIRMTKKRLANCPNDLKLSYLLKLIRLNEELNLIKSYEKIETK